MNVVGQVPLFSTIYLLFFNDLLCFSTFVSLKTNRSLLQITRAKMLIKPITLLSESIIGYNRCVRSSSPPVALLF
jgi:hypothetical protein